MSEKIPYTLIVPTAYGQMMVNRNDINQTGAFIKTGRSPDHEEIELLSQIIQTVRRDRIFLDIGANFGAYALAMSKMVGDFGKIYSFEAQRILFNMMCGTMALNAVENVYCFNMAVSNNLNSIEVPQFDYTKALNFGSVEFGTTQRERLTQERGHDTTKTEHVPAITIDALNLPVVDMMKIDVEGMEFEVLEGAERTISRDLPFLFIEHLKIDRKRLEKYLTDKGYIFYVVGANYLGVPARFKDVDGPWRKL